MGVAGRRLDVAVSEQLADYWQGLVERQGAGREAVSEVVQPNVLQSGPRPDDLPDTVEAAAAKATFRVFARKHPGAVLPSR